MYWKKGIFFFAPFRIAAYLHTMWHMIHRVTYHLLAIEIMRHIIICTMSRFTFLFQFWEGLIHVTEICLCLLSAFCLLKKLKDLIKTDKDLIISCIYFFFMIYFHCSFNYFFKRHTITCIFIWSKFFSFLIVSSLW